MIRISNELICVAQDTTLLSSPSTWLLKKRRSTHRLDVFLTTTRTSESVASLEEYGNLQLVKEDFERAVNIRGWVLMCARRAIQDMISRPTTHVNSAPCSHTNTKFSSVHSQPDRRILEKQATTTTTAASGTKATTPLLFRTKNRSRYYFACRILERKWRLACQIIA
jgi:hypothetical protein